jgi:hypothetical protein
VIVVAIADNFAVRGSEADLARRECYLSGDEMSQSLVERYDEPIAGVLSCYDRVVITGTLPGVCYAEGMTRFLHANGVRIFEYPQFVMTLRDRVREGASASVSPVITRQEVKTQMHADKKDARG